MFTTFWIIRLAIALVLAAAASQVPILGDIGKIAGGGVAGETIGFIITLLFCWFIVSRISAFLGFAFGGGITRYSGHKIYRRAQWLTFSAFMGLPIFVVMVLIINATPIAAPSDEYYSKVSKYKETEIDRIYTEQISSRDRKIESLNSERKDKVGRRMNAIVSGYRDKHIPILGNEYISNLDSARISFVYPDYGDVSDYISRAYSKLGGRYDLSFSKEQLDATIKRGYAPLWGGHLIYTSSSCGPYMYSPQSYNFNEWFKHYCFIVSMMAYYGRYADQIYNRPNSSNLFSVSIKDNFDNLRKVLDAQQKLEFSDIRSWVDDIDKLPRINDPYWNSEFPPIDEELVPYPSRIAIAQSYTIDASHIQDNYGDTLPNTFATHWWWIFILSVGIWIAMLLQIQGRISKIYTPIAEFFDAGRRGFGGSARFASMFEEWGKPYKPNTLYVGRSLYNPYDEIGLDGEAHMLTIAGSRGGKGSTAIIPNLLLWEGSAVVIDPKGTNARVTADARRRMGQAVHIIDPRNLATNESARFDPLDGIDNRDPFARQTIETIADALVAGDEKSKDPHWDDGAKSLIGGLISYVLSKPDGTKTLGDVRNIIRSLPDEQDPVWAHMAAYMTPDEKARDAAVRYIRGQETNEILSMMSSADKHTEWLSDPIMREITSNPTFRLQDLKERPTTIYLVIPATQVHANRRLIRMFINLLMNSMEIGGRSKIPVLMMIDEFLSLGKMDEIPDAFATMASYNLTLWPFVQDMGKLEEIYGKGVNSFIANSRAIQAFAASDPETQEFISKKMGNRPLSGLGKISRSNENVPLRSTDDIEREVKADSGMQYILQSGKPTMLLEKVPYYKKGTRFEGLYDPDPDFAA